MRPSPSSGTTRKPRSARPRSSPRPTASSRARPGAVARDEGDVDGAFAKAAKVLEATFEFPYLAHAAMEPMNAVARRTEDGIIEVWGGHQMPDLYQAAAAQVAETTPDKVRLHVMKTGGGFGRRAVADADVIVEAVSVAKAIGWRAPVKVQWTREDDMRGGRYRPMYVHALKAGLDADGRLIAWRNRIVGQSIVANTPFAGSSEERHRRDLGRGRGDDPVCHSEPSRRADHDRGRRPRAVVARGRIDAHRLRRRGVPRRGR